MSAAHGGSPAAPPRLSVVIPTYNRCGLLAKLLGQLAAQRLPRDEFEVIVCDDGSSDATAETVESFTGQLHLKYHFQEDLGFRAGVARNAGAKLAAAPILVFLDTGAMIGPGFLEHHLAAHDDEPCAVVGYAYGYNPEDPMPGLADMLESATPEQVILALREEPAFRDVRHDALAQCDFDLNRRAVPWSFFWTSNCSMRVADFWGIGGFDELYHGWGVEDLEFAFRIFKRGLPFRFLRDAWHVEWPHERDIEGNWQSFQHNMDLFLDRYPEPVVEIGRTLVHKRELWTWDDDYRYLCDLRDGIAEPGAGAELRDLAGRLGPDEQVAVFGAGDDIPDELATAVLFEFDRAVLDRALADGKHRGHHAIGLRTPLADGSVDRVLLTSRLAGLWTRWGADLLAEARRIGRRAPLFDESVLGDRP
ncbi:glycosyltransferase [Amycolatopsis mediterranei]|uniref:glycosyltransferase family 2 protein n=1 Tax=Amycolatopsis mediterranei TaxID=33910 RepID=UPI00341C349C